MEQYLIDNNVITNYFAELFKENSMKLVAEIIDQGPNLSVITEIEALSWINLDKNKAVISPYGTFPLLWTSNPNSWQVLNKHYSSLVDR
jgi:hypothetical protein